MRRAHGPDPLDVETIATAELQLQPLEPPVRGRLRSTCHVVRIAEPDRVRRRGRATRDAEETPDGLPAELPAEVVQCGIERSLRSRFAGNIRKTAADLVECERVLAEECSAGIETRDRRRDALAVVILRSRLAIPAHAVVTELDLDELDVDVRRPRDPKRRAERKPDGAMTELHGG